jgi:hypothetical protein
MPITLALVRVRAAASVGRKLCAPVGGDDGERRFCRKRSRHEVMAVAVLAVNGEERFAGRDATAVDRDAEDRRRQRALPFGSHRRHHRVYGPQRGRAHAANSFNAVATAS